MSTTFVAALHAEERAIIAELRASMLFRRLEGIQGLLGLYNAQPSVAVSFGPVNQAQAERAAAPVVAIAGSAPSAAPIPMPGPVASTVDAPIADAIRPQSVAHAGSGEGGQESASVVSSVRAALLGIGKA